MGTRPARRGGALNHAKLDAALAAALESAPDPKAQTLVVFVESEGGDVRTATLSAVEIDELSEQPTVVRMRLAHRLGLAGGGGSPAP